MIDYYLRRFSDGEVSATDVISLRDEFREQFAFKRQQGQLQGANRLVVVFAHHRTEEFPTALERLEQTYDVHVRTLDDGRGSVVFDVSRRV